MKEILEYLSKATGVYKGNGINHEGEPFTGTFTLQPLLEGRGFTINFSAMGKNGIIYHQEASTIAPSWNEKLTLWNFNTNTPGLLAHELKSISSKSSTSKSLVFGFNRPEDTQTFREEITLDLWDNGDLSYTYSWGLPGSEFKERSSVRMVPLTKLRTLDYVMVMVENMSRSIEFYQNLMGLSLKFSSDQWTEFNVGTITLALHGGGKPPIQRSDSQEPHSNQAGAASIGFNVDDIKAIYENLKSKGVTFTLAPTLRQNEGIFLAVAIDPDGLEISFSQQITKN